MQSRKVAAEPLPYCRKAAPHVRWASSVSSLPGLWSLQVPIGRGACGFASSQVCRFAGFARLAGSSVRRICEACRVFRIAAKPDRAIDHQVFIEMPCEMAANRRFAKNETTDKLAARGGFGKTPGHVFQTERCRR